MTTNNDCFSYSKNGLRYTLQTGPRHPQASQQATLTLTVTNPTKRPIACSGITLDLPRTTTAHGTTALTTTPETIRAAVGPGWTITTPHPGTYTATPASAHAALVPGEHLTLTLQDIRLPATPGRVTLQVTDAPHPTSHDQLPLTLVVWPSGSQGTFEDFFPEKSVSHGESATLKAHCTKNGAISYSLYYSPTGESKDTIHVCDAKLREHFTDDASDPGNLAYMEYPTLPLTGQAIAYHLQAEYQGDTKDLTSVSIVTGGDLDAGTISVHGKAQILDLDPSHYTQLKAGTVYNAPTDGFLLASTQVADFRPREAESAPAGAIAASMDRLTIHITPPGDTRKTYNLSADSTMSYQTRNITVPVRKCSQITTSTSGGASCDATWYPLGVGALSDQPLEECTP